MSTTVTTITNTTKQSSTTATTVTSTTSNPAITFPTGIDLTYESILGGYAMVGGPYEDSAAQIRVIITSPTVSEVTGMVYSDDANALLKVDYQRYFVIAAFNGWRSNIYGEFKINRIWQSGNTILIKATFNDLIIGTTPATYLPATSSQYQAVKLDRGVLTQSGELTFRLLDESGTERATTNSIITTK